MLHNPFRDGGLAHAALAALPEVSIDAAAPLALLRHCPAAQKTPLVQSAQLARRAGCAQVWIKDERLRMGLGSFKALGAAYAIAAEVPAGATPDTALEGRVFVTASAGNHGLSVAVGARVFGARAVIYIAENVPESFADLLRVKGAHVVRAGRTYDQSMRAAADAAEAQGWTLLSDSSWDGYIEPARMVMEGYTVLAHEIAEEMSVPPSLIVLQAGVGGMAAAVAAFLRASWGTEPQIVVVEPEAAPALHHSIAAGRPVETHGPESSMGRLDCKTPSLIALKALSKVADAFALVDDDMVARALPDLADAGFVTTPSGGAGLAAVLSGRVPVSETDRVLCILSEGPL